MNNDRVYNIETNHHDTDGNLTGSSVSVGGFTKREYFAAMMLQGLLANPERYNYMVRLSGELSNEELSAKNAHKAVKMADALIAELNKEQP